MASTACSHILSLVNVKYHQHEEYFASFDTCNAFVLDILATNVVLGTQNLV